MPLPWLSATVGVVPDAQGLRVSFVETDPGSSPVTSYTVTCIARDGSNAVLLASGAGSPIVVPGTVLRVTYSCTVRATNGEGSSATSAPRLCLMRFTNVQPLLNLLLD